MPHPLPLDPLTGLASEIPSDEALRGALESWARAGFPLVAMCCVDLDEFREIGEQLGHDGGNAMLQEAARRLGAAAPAGAFVVRTGGDEFSVVMGTADERHCRDLLACLVTQLTKPCSFEKQTIRLEATVGVSLASGAEQPLELMLRQARHAVFFAKREGGGRVRFFDAQAARVDQQVLWERRRIEGGLLHSEFFLLYQPKVDMRSGTVVGVEALVRWQHPHRGVLQPWEFVPLIEDHELVEHLGDWAIGAALQQANDWAEAGRDISISVNIGPRHMARLDFLERLAFHLSQWPLLHAGSLELEILETTAINELATIADLVAGCQLLGVPVTMDDFGTGYASLAYMRQLPVDALKLDQSFVRGILDNDQDRAIVAAVLMLAQSLGRTTIAEGVETVEHGQALLALGCTLGQGYGIAKPMPAEALLPWIAEFERAPPWGRAGDAAVAATRGQTDRSRM